VQLPRHRLLGTRRLPPTSRFKLQSLQEFAICLLASFADFHVVIIFSFGNVAAVLTQLRNAERTWKSQKT